MLQRLAHGSLRAVRPEEAAALVVLLQAVVVEKSSRQIGFYVGQRLVSSRYGLTTEDMKGLESLARKVGADLRRV